MSKSQPQSQDHAAKMIGAGIGLTAAAVAAAGAYFLYGSKSAAKNRKAVKSWMLKAKAEILEKLEDAKEITKEEYDMLVDQVVGAYTTVQSASKKDLKELRDEMKSHWQGITKAAPKPKKAAKKSTKTAAKKVTKQVSKSAVK
jgi:flagellar basal body-associated protein FliL